MILLLTLLLQPEYAINGQKYVERAEVASIPQCGRITIDAADQPAVEVADRISKQSGFPLKWDGPKDAKITISAKDAPFVAVVAEFARTMKAGFEEFQSAEGPFVQVPGAFVKAPVLAWHADGPVVVTWHGLTDREKNPFADKDEPARSPKHFAMRLWQDPRCHAIKRPQAAPRDQAVTFTVGGKSHVLKSDHEPSVFSSSAPTWQFDPRSELEGESASIEVAVPLYLPTRLAEGAIAPEKDQVLASGDITVTVESVKSEKKKVPDPKDVFKKIEVVEAVVVVHLRHKDGVLWDEIAKSGRQPTEEESARLVKLQEGGGALALHQVGTGGVAGVVKRASGVSSPMHGYRYEVKFLSTDASFAPGQLSLAWAGNFQEVGIRFKIAEAPLK